MDIVIRIFKENVQLDKCVLNEKLKPHGRLELVDNETGIEGAKVYIDKGKKKIPSWVSKFNLENHEIFTRSSSAIILIPIIRKKKERIFAITFGHSYHSLIEDNIDYDFAIYATLNALDENWLNAIELNKTESSALQRTQVRKVANTGSLYFDSHQDILKSISGYVKDEYKELFSSITAGASIKVNTSVEPKELASICEKLYDLSLKDDWKRNFPEFQNIQKVRDTALIKKLNTEMLVRFKSQYEIYLDPLQKHSVTNNQKITICYNEINNFEDTYEFAYQYKVQKLKENAYFPELYLDHLNELLKEKGVKPEDISFEDIRVLVKKTNEDSKEDGFKIIRLLQCEINFLSENDEFYYFIDNQWFVISSDFIKEITEEINNICVTTTLVDYTKELMDEVSREKDKYEYTEGRYNRAVAFKYPQYICLDTKDILKKGRSKIEPCDLLEIEINNKELKFYHLKRSTRSSTLSHCFNQGVNSLEILRKYSESATNLIDLVQKKGGELTEKELSYKYHVIYGLITSKKPEQKAENLPVFSRISLSRIITEIRKMNAEVSLMFIPVGEGLAE